MKPNRYQRRATPRVRPALSPRNPVTLHSAQAGAGGNAVSGGANQSPTVGQANAGNGARRPARNVMAKSRDGGMPITYYAPMERWQATTERTAGRAPARIAPQAALATHEKTLAAAASAGIRQAAMARHSILRTTGAVDVIPRTGPVWLSDDPEFAARTRDARIRSDARRI